MSKYRRDTRAERCCRIPLCQAVSAEATTNALPAIAIPESHRGVLVQLPSPSLTIPPIYCPLPSLMHPAADAVETHSIAWLAGFGIGDNGQRDRVVNTRAAQWCGRIAPHASEAGIRLITDWTYLAFVFDDVYFDEGPANRRPVEAATIMGQVMRTLDSPEAAVPDNPYIAAFHDVSRRARMLADPVSFARWIGGHEDWFFGELICMNHRSSGIATFTLENCLNLGFRDAATKLCVSQLEIAQGITLPDRCLLRPALRALVEAASFIVTCDAAICSYQREIAQGSHQINIVNVLRHELRCSHQDAIYEAVALRDQVTLLYSEATQRMRRTAEPDLLAYIRLLSHLVSGNLEWCLSTPRYHKEFGGYTSVPGEGMRVDAPAAGHHRPSRTQPDLLVVAHPG